MNADMNVYEVLLVVVGMIGFPYFLITQSMLTRKQKEIDALKIQIADMERFHLSGPASKALASIVVRCLASCEKLDGVQAMTMRREIQDYLMEKVMEVAEPDRDQGHLMLSPLFREAMSSDEMAHLIPFLQELNCEVGGCCSSR